MIKRTVLLLLVIFALMAHAACAFVIKGPDKELASPSYRIRGTEYIPVTVICEAYGVDWKWDPVSMTADLNRGASRLRMRVDEYKVYVNGNIEVQEKPVIVHKGAVCVPRDFIKTIFGRFFTGPKPAPVSEDVRAPEAQTRDMAPYYKIQRIVIDPGHGGYDPGAIGRSGIREKNIVLDISRKVRALLEAEGIDVAMTRSDDRFIPLWGRVEITDRFKADLFVSIHANASKARRLKGFEVYYISEAINDDAKAKQLAEKERPLFDKEAGYIHSWSLDAILWDLELTENRRNSIELAKCILDEVGIGKRRLKSARFFVLKGAAIPAVLVEVGYITNVEECARLGRADYRTEMAKKIARGILQFKEEFEASNGFTR